MRFLAVAGALVLVIGLTPEVARAERGAYFDDDGNRCEYNVVEDLIKTVCRDPRNFGDYRVCYGELRPDVVFVDCFGEDRFVISAEIPTDEFLRRIRRGGGTRRWGSRR